jgi:hypothetical protein
MQYGARGYRLTGLVVLLALAAVACGGEPEDPAGEDATAPEAPAEEVDDEPDDEDLLALDASCENSEWGFVIEYPADWEVNEEGPLPACSVFHPESIEFPDDRELPAELAIALREEPQPLEELDPDVDPTIEVRSRDRVTIDERDAEILEVEATGDGAHAQGLVTYRYHVDRGANTLVAETHDLEVLDLDFEARRGLLDAMMDALVFTESAAPDGEGS